LVAAQEVMVALDGIHSALQADGYELAVNPDGTDGFVICVEAGPEACAECLIPKSLMADMISAVAPPGVAWSLRYPTEQPAGD
jgi:hypothetical protein